jgi:hypothetical protein
MQDASQQISLMGLCCVSGDLGTEFVNTIQARCALEDHHQVPALHATHWLSRLLCWRTHGLYTKVENKKKSLDMKQTEGWLQNVPEQLRLTCYKQIFQY